MINQGRFTHGCACCCAQQAQVATATIKLVDGTRILTRGTGSSRESAERAAALLLCEHPGVCVHLQQPHWPGGAQHKSVAEPSRFVDSRGHTALGPDRKSLETAQPVTPCFLFVPSLCCLHTVTELVSVKRTLGAADTSLVVATSGRRFRRRKRPGCGTVGS